MKSLFLLIAMCLAMPVSGDELFDKLFFTPDKRVSLDRQRQSNVIQQAETVQEEALTVNGIVKSSSGKNTVWINGHEQAAKIKSSRVIIQLDNGTISSVQVGETVKRSTGDKSDIIRDGTVKQ